MPKNAAGIELRQPGNNKAHNCVLQAFKGPRGERKWECAARQGEHNPVGDGNAGGPIPPNEGMAEEAVPAIHRGHPPLSEPLPARGTAHDATNLFCCGRYTLLESIVEWVLAHGELQEEKSPAPGWYFPRGQTILRAGGCLSHLWCIA